MLQIPSSDATNIVIMFTSKSFRKVNIIISVE